MITVEEASREVSAGMDGPVGVGDSGVAYSVWEHCWTVRCCKVDLRVPTMDGALNNHLFSK